MPPQTMVISMIIYFVPSSQMATQAVRLGLVLHVPWGHEIKAQEVFCGKG